MMQQLSPNTTLSAACGLFCPGCSLYIATTEDPERLKRLAALFGVSEEKVKCRGCRSEQRSPYCETCAMIKCADARGVEFCGACGEYPCETLKSFQAAMPHRRDLWKDQARIKETGFETWFAEMRERYACSACGVINSAYDLKCRGCGAEPGNAYVQEHREAIEKHLSR